MNLKELGLAFAKLRISRGISQQELSLCLGKNASYINKVENGKINISQKTLFAILEYFNISYKDFINNYL